MPIDYSKWDNLELSDDSDVEIHPNIERGTFLRLRQKKIRDDRENRRIKREGNEAMITMNKDLIERISKLRAQVLEADEPKMNAILQQWQTDVAEAHKHKVERDGAISQGKQPEQPSEEDMMAALKARISDDLLKAAAKLDSLEEKQAEFAKQLAVHVENLRKNLQTAERELEQVKKEEAKHVAPDSIVHDGFDRSFVSTAKPADANKSSISAKKTTVTTDEVLNPGSVGKHSGVAVEEEEIEGMDENGELELDSDARAFAKLSKLTDSNDFIRKNLSIISDRKSDQIMAQAFTMELDGKKKLARQYVKQALILTYILKMGASGVNVFFNRVGPKGPAQDSFERDVASYYERIEERCKVIKSERDADDADAEPEVESIQLQCDDPNAPIRIYVPGEDEEDAQRLELFDQLPEDFKDSLRVGTLEAINKVLATVSGSEAERLLGICGEGGFLAIDGEIVVDPSENAEQSTN